jgi:hypothetical protein
LLADHRAAAPGIVLSETGLSVLPRQTLAFVPLYFAAAVARADLDDQLNALGIEGS